MSRSNSCLVCTYLIELVAGVMTGYIFIYLDDTPMTELIAEYINLRLDDYFAVLLMKRFRRL